jgi:hypothetical protein
MGRGPNEESRKAGEGKSGPFLVSWTPHSSRLGDRGIPLNGYHFAMLSDLSFRSLPRSIFALARTATAATRPIYSNSAISAAGPSRFHFAWPSKTTTSASVWPLLSSWPSSNPVVPSSKSAPRASGSSGCFDRETAPVRGGCSARALAGRSCRSARQNQVQDMVGPVRCLAAENTIRPI